MKKALLFKGFSCQDQIICPYCEAVQLRKGAVMVMEQLAGTLRDYHDCEVCRQTMAVGARIPVPSWWRKLWSRQSDK